MHAVEASVQGSGRGLTLTLSRIWTLLSMLSRNVSQVASLSGLISVHTTHTTAETTMATMLPASAGPEALVVAMVRVPVDYRVLGAQVRGTVWRHSGGSASIIPLATLWWQCVSYFVGTNMQRATSWLSEARLRAHNNSLEQVDRPPLASALPLQQRPQHWGANRKSWIEIGRQTIYDFGGSEPSGNGGKQAPQSRCYGSALHAEAHAFLSSLSKSCTSPV